MGEHFGLRKLIVSMCQTKQRLVNNNKNTNLYNLIRPMTTSKKIFFMWVYKDSALKKFLFCQLKMFKKENNVFFIDLNSSVAIKKYLIFKIFKDIPVRWSIKWTIEKISK